MVSTRSSNSHSLWAAALMLAASSPAVATLAPACSHGVVGLLVPFLSKVPAAQTFCSAKFPIPHATTTLVEPTVTSTESTFTATSTAPAVTVTTGTTTVYTTSTATSTSYSTAYVCPTPGSRRKVKGRAPNKQVATTTTTHATTTTPCATSSQLAALSALVHSDASVFCSCIETTITNTFTTTPVATSTPYTSFTPTSNVIATTTAAAPPTTSFTTSVTTVTITNGQTVTGGGPCECEYTLMCGQMFDASSIIETIAVSNEIECVNACDNYDNCFEANYQISTGSCTLYRDEGSSTADSSDFDDIAFAGTCFSGENPVGCNIG